MSDNTIIYTMILLSGVLILDKYSFGEFGISQPLIVSSLLGLAVGDFISGALMGLIMQPIWLVEIPVGRKVPLDVQGGGISGAVAFFSLRLFGAGIEQAVLLSLIIAVLASVWGGWLDRFERYINGKIAMRLKTIRTRLHLILVHVVALDVAFLRGIVMAVVAAILAKFAFLTIPFIPQIHISKIIAATFTVGLAGAIVMLGLKKRLLPMAIGFVSWIGVWVLLKF